MSVPNPAAQRAAIVLGSVALVASLFGAASRAEAQVVELPYDDVSLYSSQEGEARSIANVGMGLTIGGVSTTLLGTGLVFGLDGGGWGTLITAFTLWGIGGLAGVIGIPTWIAGGVRADITQEDRSDDLAREAAAWETAGIAITIIGSAVTTLGAVLLGLGIGDDTGLALSGVVLLPVGAFVALFIGTPMWAEGARF